ncbi:hypothetical protein N1031_07100 [Herbiconiux moechotypicola]|uniref:CopG family transcriptional regulator n=1 Tax=Herbiconiux moechotypicola TaxID=637393 RepID=A0ABN3DGN4_9MICO|nr:hypothetical protein [Herbiconiux moechotypicola]MCS5729524.1 hypothetical protein [Herbiconiux moechotypicola]
MAFKAQKRSVSRGRPAVDERREHVKNVSFTEAERALVEAAAAREEPRVPVARWIREAAIEKATREAE